MNKLSFILAFLLICSPALAGVDFDGVRSGGNDNDILDCNDVTDPTTEVSFSAWVKADTFTNYNRFLNDGVTNGGGVQFFTSGDAGGGTATIGMAIATDGTSLSDTWGTSTISTGTWAHVGGTVDTVANTASVYIDGSGEEINTSVAGTIVRVAGEDFAIGNRAIDQERSFDGIITELTYWNKELTAAEFSLMASSKVKRFALQIQPANIIGHWSLEDEADGTSADGDTFLDLSGNGNTCTGDDGANNTGLTAAAEEVLTYP